MAKRTLTAVAAACLLLSAGRARAQSAQDKAVAEVLFEEGKDLMKVKKYGLACPKFLESNRLDTGLGTMLWLADCYDKNGQSASAWGEFREAMDVAARNHDAREKVARDRSNKLEPTLSKMTIVVGVSAQVPGMVVKRDNVEVGQTLWGEAVPVDPGAHTVTVSAPRKRPWETTIQVIRGVKNVDVPVMALDDAPFPFSL
jgi:serine/threonine-protein kinase